MSHNLLFFLLILIVPLSHYNNVTAINYSFRYSFMLIKQRLGSCYYKFTVFICVLFDTGVLYPHYQKRTNLSFSYMALSGTI